MRIKLLPRPVFKRGHAGVGRVVRLMVPALFAISVTQINLVIDMLIASFLQTGSISWLYYSDRLMEFPLGVFGVALATVILPNLSEQHARGDASRFSHMLDWALRWTLLVGIPAAIGLIILAGPMLVTIFNYGEFSDSDVAMATRSLVCYAIGLTGFILIKVLANGFFSRQDTSTPVKIGVVAMLTNLVLNILLVFPLAHAGLALATSLAAFVNAGLLFYFLRKRKQFDADPGWALFAGRIGLACVIMAVFLLYFVPATRDWLGFDVFERVWQMALWVVAGGLVYIATLWLGGLRPRHMLLDN